MKGKIHNSVQFLIHKIISQKKISSPMELMTFFCLPIMPSEIGLYNRLTMFLQVLDHASSENVGQEGHLP